MKRAMAFAASAMMLAVMDPASAQSTGSAAPAPILPASQAAIIPATPRIGPPINLYPAGGAPKQAHSHRVRAPAPTLEANAAPSVVAAASQ